jgi:uncharacterized integral membrane protein
MLNAILDTIKGIITSFPVEAVATIAVIVGGGGLLLTGWRYLVGGIQALFTALNAVVNALGAFFRAFLVAVGTTVGGLIILAMGGVAIWWALLLLGGG